MGRGEGTFLKKGSLSPPQSSFLPPSSRLLDGSPDPVQTDVAEAVGGPVDAPRLAADIVAVKEAPEAGIGGIVAVVAEREKLVGGHGDRPPVVAARNHDERLRMLRVRLLHFNAVAVQYLVPHLQRVAGNAHNALDVVEAPILGVTEHDDVPDLGLDAADQVVVIERIPKAVEEFVDQQVIADLERFQHGAGRNLERLHDERGQDQSQSYRPDERLGVFPYHGLAKPLDERKLFIHKEGGPLGKVPFNPFGNGGCLFPGLRHERLRRGVRGGALLTMSPLPRRIFYGT